MMLNSLLSFFTINAEFLINNRSISIKEVVFDMMGKEFSNYAKLV